MSDKEQSPAKESTGDTKPNLDPEVEKQLREAADAEDTLVKDMQTKCREEFDKRASMLSDQFQVAFNSQMSNVADRYTSHTHDRVTVQQTDVLKTNKIFRDVSRDLGADWKPVFAHLLKNLEEQQVKVETAKIERQKPFIQPFKALNTWKDLMGENFNIRALVEALMSIDRRELAEKVMDILDNNDLDSLYAMDRVGKGIAGGFVSKRPPPASDETGSNTTSNGTEEQKPRPKPAAPAKEDPIGDRVLLKIAKDLGKDWAPMAEALSLTEEELLDCKESGGDTYHGGFKALFTWRDNQVEAGVLTQECAVALKAALNKVGKADLANSVNVS